MTRLNHPPSPPPTSSTISTRPQDDSTPPLFAFYTHTRARAHTHIHPDLRRSKSLRGARSRSVPLRGKEEKRKKEKRGEKKISIHSFRFRATSSPPRAVLATFLFVNVGTRSSGTRRSGEAMIYIYIKEMLFGNKQSATATAAGS